jgi:hypothetical protein
MKRALNFEGTYWESAANACRMIQVVLRMSFRVVRMRLLVRNILFSLCRRRDITMLVVHDPIKAIKPADFADHRPAFSQ